MQAQGPGNPNRTRRTTRLPTGARVLLGVVLGVTGCEDAQTTPPPSELSTPPGVLSTPTRRVRRLSSREYNNVVRDLLGDTSQPASRFVIDAYQNGYDNGSVGLAVQSDQVLDYQSAAEALAETAVKKNLARLLGGCDPKSQGAAACRDAFIAKFAPRAYRRPLTTDEAQQLRELYASEVGAPDPFERGVQTMLEVLLQSPQFLYREELGAREAVGAAGAPIQLTEYEVASELSFLLTGSLPDDELWAAVTSGRLQTADDVLREALRLRQKPEAKAALRAFLHKWLATDRVAALSKDAGFYPTWSQALAGSMASELDQFYDDALWSGAGSLRRLFTSDQSFVDAGLGALYGVSVPGPGFQRVSLDPTLRKGVLTRAGFLSVHAATDSSGPVSRGVFLLHALLCLPPPQPPPNVPPAIPAADPSAKDLTTRQRFEKHVSDPACAGCHRIIDGVGFGFEQFDGIGAHRTMEKGKPVDTSGTLIGTGEIDGSYTGVSELAERLAGSKRLADCFVRQTYRYALGQIEPDGDDVRLLVPDFTSEAQLTDALIAVVKSPVFATRRFEPADK